MSELAQQLEHWIAQKDSRGLNEFLQALSQKERSSLAPEVFRLQDAYRSEGLLRLQNKTAYRFLVAVAAFACLNKAEMQKYDLRWLDFEFAYQAGLFEWCRPNWLSTLLDEFLVGEMENFHLDYLMMMRLKEQGLWEPSPTKIAYGIAYCIFARQKAPTYPITFAYVPQYLEVRPEALETHIWYCFEHPVPFYDIEPSRVEDLPEEVDACAWHYTLGRLVGEGKLDRLRLLTASLNACALPLSRLNLGWHADLFTYLAPQKTDLLQMQPALFSVFHCETHRPISIALRALKQIATHYKFEVQGFIQQAGILFSHEKKSIVKSALILTQKVASTNGLAHQALCELVLPTFKQTNTDLQMRAAKFIKAFGATEDPSLRSKLSQYQTYILGEVSLLLTDFLPEQAPEVVRQPTGFAPILSAKNAVNYPDTFKEFLSVLGKLKNERTSSHFDLILYGCHRFANSIQAEDLPLLLPGINRIYENLSSNTGVDAVLGYFVASWSMHLIRRFPKEASEIKQQYKAHISALYLPKRAYELTIWPQIKAMMDVPALKVFIMRCQRVLQAIQKEELLPLLAVPSHLPHWIDPAILLERVQAYDLAKKEMPVIELQIALCRTRLENTSELVARLPQKLSQDRLALMQYLFDPQTPVPQEFTHPETLEIAAFHKSGGLVPTDVFSQSKYILAPAHWTGSFVWRVKKKQKARYLLHIDNKQQLIRRETNLFGEIWDWLQGDEPPFHLYREMKIVKGKWSGVWAFATNEADMLRTMSLIPSFPDKLFGDWLEFAFPYPAYSNKHSVKGILSALFAQRTPFGDMGHLSIAMILLCEHRNARLRAGELILWGLDHQLLDMRQLGIVLGKLLSIEFAPLSRLIDALEVCFAELRQQYPQVCFDGFTEIIARMPINPVRNLKLLLAYYWELLLASDDTSLNEAISDRLLHWRSSRSLHALLSKIESELRT